MSATEEISAEDRRSHASAHDATDNEPASSESRFKRLKQKLASKLGKMLAGAIARLQGLRARLGGGAEETEERPRAKPVPPPPPKLEAPPVTTAEPSARKPHKLRNFALILVLLLAAAGLGAAAAYSIFSRLLKDQSLAIESHEQEIHAFQLEEQEQGKKLAEALRRLEEETKLRNDMEARLVAAEQRRLAAESSQKVAEVAKAEAAAKPEQPAEKASALGAKITASPSKASTFRPPSAGNCSLAASDPAALKRCVEAYNRK